MVCLFIKQNDTGLYYELGRTNMIKNDHNPEFSKSILVNKEKIKSITEWISSGGKLEPNTSNNLRFVVVDIDTARGKIRNNDIIGIVDWKIQDLLDSTNFQLKLDLTVHARKYGEIYIIGEPVHSSTLLKTITIRLAADDLPRMDYWTETDGMLIITRKLNNRSDQIHRIYVSEAQMNTKSPYWKDIKLPFNHWCNGDIDAEITIEVWDYNKTSKSYIGEVTTTTRQLLNLPRLTLEKKKGRTRSKYRGFIQVMNCFIEPKEYAESLLNTIPSSSGNFELMDKKITNILPDSPVAKPLRDSKSEKKTKSEENVTSQKEENGEKGGDNPEKLKEESQKDKPEVKEESRKENPGEVVIEVAEPLVQDSQ